MRKSVCIVSFSPIHQDGRALRQVSYLAQHYDVSVIGSGQPDPSWKESPSIKWLPVAPEETGSTFRNSVARAVEGAYLLLGKLWPKAYDRLYWGKAHRAKALELAKASGSALFQANDWDALPVAVEAARLSGAKVVFDARGYLPPRLEGSRHRKSLVNPFIKHLLKRYAPAVDASCTVAPALADRLKREFGLNATVVLNAHGSTQVPRRGVDPRSIRLVHHGVGHRDRRLEIMIRAVARCDERYSLHFMLVESQPGYVQHLRALADRLAKGRVHFHAPVEPSEAVERVAEYDIGFCVLPPSRDDDEPEALPDEFFDFVAAGLAVCIGPSPSMAELVSRHRFGCVAPSFRSRDVADTLNGLSVDQIEAMRRAARVAARLYTANMEMAKLVCVYQSLI